jgi:hypothetical protein
MPNFAMTDTVFMQIFKEFNDLLNRDGGKIGVIESDSDRSVDSAVSAKLTPELLVAAIEEAIKDSLDYEEVKITKVESFDYGYKLEVTVSYVQDGEDYTEKYYINHAVLY